MNITVERFITGPIETNTYVVSDDQGHCLVIDPSRGQAEVLAYIQKKSLVLESVVLTHAHFDHIYGMPELLEPFRDVKVYVYVAEKMFLTNADYNGSAMFGRPFAYTGECVECLEGLVSIGSFTATVLHVPGHTPGGMALVFDGICFSGDVLFANSIGRSDFPGGDGDQLVAAIRLKLFPLPDETVVYPGHGGRTTIGREKKHNPFLQ